MAPWSDDVIAASGATVYRAGCLLIPFLPVRAHGFVQVTRTHVEFRPIFLWGWIARAVSVPLADIADVQFGGGGVELNVMYLFAVGRRLTLTTRDGRRHVFHLHGAQAEDVYVAVQRAIDEGLDA